MRCRGQLFSITLTLIALCGMLPLSGCLVVGASSRGGFFVWPGGLGLLIMLGLLILLLRRR